MVSQQSKEALVCFGFLRRHAPCLPFYTCPLRLECVTAGDSTVRPIVSSVCSSLWTGPDFTCHLQLTPRTFNLHFPSTGTPTFCCSSYPTLLCPDMNPGSSCLEVTYMTAVSCSCHTTHVILPCLTRGIPGHFVLCSRSLFRPPALSFTCVRTPSLSLCGLGAFPDFIEVTANEVEELGIHET